jgi:hypothetical protein
MSTAFSDDALVEAVRSSSPDTRARLLRELLADHIKRGIGPGKAPPVLSPDRETELNQRLTQLDQSIPLRDYIAKLGPPGGSS